MKGVGAAADAGASVKQGGECVGAGNSRGPKLEDNGWQAVSGGDGDRSEGAGGLEVKAASKGDV